VKPPTPRGEDPSGEGVEPRRAALRILDRVLRTGQTVEVAAAVAQRLIAADRALTLAIVGEALRRIPELDGLIDGVTRQRLPDDSKARMVLRLALAQRLTMQVPDHAIVATALPLVDGGPRRLVHGILGTLLRRPLAASEAPSLPSDVEERWRKAWGEDTIAAARRQIAHRPPLDLTFIGDCEAQAYAKEHSAVSLAPNHVRLKSASVSELPGFSEGRWWVQDLAASLPARLIPSNARDVLDACAAPGGKTMQLSAAGHRVLALDKSQSRLGRLAENLRRTGLQAQMDVADALRWKAPRQFDAVLLDAPCTATGTFRRHPEVLYRVGPSFIGETADAQLQLLARMSNCVRPGGSLVYSVCSLEPEEGEEAIRAFLAANPAFHIVAPTGIADWLPHSSEGWVRILPASPLEEQGGLDGFFMARLVRSG
jgi:16S rRNA (cytosine967-C5)-methyltransferase